MKTKKTSSRWKLEDIQKLEQQKSGAPIDPPPVKKQPQKKRSKNNWSLADLRALEQQGNIKLSGVQTEQASLPFAEVEHQRRKSKAKGYEEFHLQVRCVRWLDLFYPELKKKRLRFHVANQGFAGGEKTGKLLKAMGKIKGVTDFFIMVKRHGYSGLIIDFKAKGESLSDEQQEFFESMRAQGFLCEEVDGDEQFYEVVISYLGASPLLGNNWKIK